MSVQDAQRLLEAAGDAEHILLIGVGDGHLFEAIDRSGASTRIIVLEPEPGIAESVVGRREWRQWQDSGRLHVLAGPGYVGASSVASKVNGGKPSIIFVDDELKAASPKDVDRAVEVARRIQVEAKDNFEARRKFAGRYLLQTLANLPVIERSGNVSSLDGVFARVPAVIAAAGPSLDHSLRVLSEYQDRVVVIGADTTLRPLLAGGVRPHLIVAVDPSDVNARHLRGVPDTSGIHLVGEGSLHPSALECFDGRTFNFKVSNHEPWPWLAAAGIERGTLRAWGSVATSAFDLAVRMGCNPIVFVGHDMAFTNGRPYCDNTVFHEEWRAYLISAWGRVLEDHMQRYEEVMMEGRVHMPATDINGTAVKTTSHFIAFRDWIVEQTTLTTGTTFINATGAGLLGGPRIEQTGIGQTLQVHATRPVKAREVIASRHQQSQGAPGAVRELATALADRFDSEISRDTLSKWVEFSAGTVDRETLRAALSARLTSW